jgi:hypothetical protein
MSQNRPQCCSVARAEEARQVLQQFRSHRVLAGRLGQAWPVMDTLKLIGWYLEFEEEIFQIVRSAVGDNHPVDSEWGPS